MCGCTGAGDSDCVLAIVPIQVKTKKGNKVVKTYAFLDPGSSATFCTEALMDELNVSGRRTDILLRTMGDEKSVSSYIVRGLEVSSLEDNNFLKLPDVFSQSTIPVNKENVPLQEDVDRWPYLKRAHLLCIEAEVGLLIGTNVPKAIEPWQVISSVGEGPYAVRTMLGWTVNGPIKEDGGVTARGERIHLTANRISVVQLDELWKQQFKFDFPECHQDELEMSREDRQFIDLVSQSTKLEQGHYSICFPLRNGNVNMPNNRKVVEQRALSLRKKFEKNVSFHADYTSFMGDNITKGHAVRVPFEEVNRDDGRLWYIPHHGVYHPKKHKIRVVFDCGASFREDVLKITVQFNTSVNTVLQNFYVDDCLKSVSTEEEAVSLYHDLSAICAKGGFCLTEWQWSDWLKELHQLENFEVGRCFKPPGFGEAVSAQLHHFADASEEGYGTASYLLSRNSYNQVHCAFILGKARVAPLKPTTIPHMELTAVTVAGNMDKMLRRELQLQLEDSVFWSDSTVVLKYISNETTSFCTFVANRVSAVLKVSQPSQWRYVNTAINPADHASRGLKVDAFIQNKAWISGPDFLKESEDKWPENPDHSREIATEDPEVKRNAVVNVLTAEEDTDTVKQLLETLLLLDSSKEGSGGDPQGESHPSVSE
ncbi:hypothetical protein SKAU_G00097280 [Synaphobranchus kaupii]|uniref:Peptidase aspartic putative domain-containing protein n=1 Tax=Synaphobranchus kaupii TaxID=118154 RepID=A0A9Q1FYS4_SYNKA|nr:hypothetical protein SKAU_G00097280 [Synaphobranchus kaupii]